MSDCVTTFERDFRCLLVRLVEELGDEKFKNFCFILSVPEAIRERHRTDVLWHLLEQGKLSPRRPRDFVRLLRDDLHRDDLAAQAETAIEKFEDFRQPIQETISQPQDAERLEVQPLQDVQPRQKRVPKSPKRYAVYFESNDHDGPGLQQSATCSTAQFSPLEPVEEEPRLVENDGSDLKEDSAFYNPEMSYSPNIAKELWKYVHSKEARKYWGERTMHGMLSHFHYVIRRDKDATMLPKEFDSQPDNPNDSLGISIQGHQALSRSASNVSKASVRSSGYYSMRDSTISVDSMYLQDEASTSEPIAALEVPEQSRSRSTSLTSFKSAPESWSCSSRRSSADDSPDDDYQSCYSMTSLESQSSEDRCGNEASLQTHETRDRCEAPASTYTPILGEMRLKRKDVLKHIEKRKPEALYNSDPFPSEKKAYQFELRLFPTNFQQDGSAVYINTRGPVDLAGLLPMNIKVCVCATDAPKASPNEKQSCINSLEKIVDMLPQHPDYRYQCCVASFPKVVSHEQLLAVKSDYIIVQVVMEYVG